jgi:hypothetical protein
MTFVHYDYEKNINRLREIKLRITPDQYALAKKLIIPKPTEKHLLIMNKVLRFDILR